MKPGVIPPLEMPDRFHLEAAEGWIGLGDYGSADDELEQISPATRLHPDVLQLRWRIPVSYTHLTLPTNREV